MVAPDRETPGTRATHCDQADERCVSIMVRSRSPRSCWPTRSAYTITALQSTSEPPTHHSERSGPLMTSLPRKPTMPIGIEPTMMYQPKRWSKCPRYSGRNSPRNHAAAIRQMSLRK